MRWRWWQRDPPERDGAVEMAQSEARKRLWETKAQGPRVAAAENAAKALARQTERLADEVERALRLRGNA